jgi:glutamate racemase
MVEAGVLDGPAAEAAVRDYIGPMLAEGIDELALGCTHFPAMRAVFERVAGPGVEVIDSGAAVALQARRVLTRESLLSPEDAGAASTPRAVRDDDEFWCSGDTSQFDRVASAILAQQVHARGPRIDRLV